MTPRRHRHGARAGGDRAPSAGTKPGSDDTGTARPAGGGAPKAPRLPGPPAGAARAAGMLFALLVSPLPPATIRAVNRLLGALIRLRGAPGRR